MMISNTHVWKMTTQGVP